VMVQSLGRLYGKLDQYTANLTCKRFWPTAVGDMKARLIEHSAYDEKLQRSRRVS